jgi:hypothetical protein
MFGLAAICWTIWKVRNKTCFDKKKRPRTIVKCFTQFICSYVGLYLEEAQQVINAVSGDDVEVWDQDLREEER